MAKITSLTPTQQAQVDVWRERWLGIGTCTVPADRPRAEAAIAEMYALIGEARPTFIWCQSPATASLAIALLRSIDKKALNALLRTSLWASLRASLEDSLEDSLRASLWASLRDSLEDSLRASLRASLWASLRDSLEDSLRASLGASLWASLRASLEDSLRASLRDSLWASLYWGQHEVAWIGFYRYCAEVLGVKYADESSRTLQLWSEVGESCCWWWPYRGTVIASDRPRVVRMESNPQRLNTSRLHCSDGPALLFGDGWPVYAWHGVRVSQRTIEAPETLTAKQITEERNAEVRRVMIERFGQERYMRDSGAQIVHKDDWGTLWRAELPEDEPLVMVEVVNSTPEPDGTFKNYMLRVPPTMVRARQAVAWTFGASEQEYVLAQQS